MGQTAGKVTAKDAGEKLAHRRRGTYICFHLLGPLQQGIYSRNTSYEDVDGAERLASDRAMRAIGYLEPFIPLVASEPIGPIRGKPPQGEDRPHSPTDLSECRPIGSTRAEADWANLRRWQLKEIYPMASRKSWRRDTTVL